MRGAIRMPGNSNHELRRRPVLDDRADLAPAHVAVRSVDGLERTRRARNRVADRDTDAAGAKVKPEHDAITHPMRGDNGREK